jgi:uncharacterized membrane protein HdeD (DUF308 family)
MDDGKGGFFENSRGKINRRLEFPGQIADASAKRALMKADDEKGISLILIYIALLFFLLGVAARMKMNFHHRMEISTAGFVVSGVLAALAVVLFLFSLRKRRG